MINYSKNVSNTSSTVLCIHSSLICMTSQHVLVVMDTMLLFPRCNPCIKIYKHAHVDIA